MNEHREGHGERLCVAMLSGASSPWTATYPLSWESVLALVRELKGGPR